MNRMGKYVVLGLGVLTLGACATTDNLDTYNKAKGACTAGSAFNAALCSGYNQLATEEQTPYEPYVIDPRDRDYYATKAIAAGATGGS